MKRFFQLDTDESRRSLMSRARQVALLALQKYDVNWEHIHYNQLSDTITFKIEAEDDECFLMRIHSDMMTQEEILSEVMVLNALSPCVDFSIPEGIASRDGSYVLEIHTEQGYHNPSVTLMRWVNGELASGKLTDSRVFNIGIMTAKLHEASMRFVPPTGFTRPTWGEDSFRCDMTKLGQYYNVFLSDEAWKSYQAAADKIISELGVMHQTNENYGFIHSDLHIGNLVFNGDEVSPIDFGRCGYGYFLYDVAGAILGLYPQQRVLFIQGYESARKLQEHYVSHLECFFVMFMIENYCTHCSDPRETAGLIAEQPYAQAIIRAYLNGEPFLFNPIPLIDI
ncbi:phosphotransferase [Paenibacillus sp. RC67]|uniref:phosphotransferase enzyme family protein n=1 Tax=Paenibacillus sp. RC67 TaxID=3039392 RepID=UPI0024AE2506|nr:phosphotransferase [Paenibacillus sp. RC67]